MEDNWIFETTDPLGSKVVLSQTQWQSHLINNHTVMKGNEQAIKEAIEDPEAIFKSNSEPNTEVYFGLSTSATYGQRNFTKVIVDFTTPTGYIISAWPQKDIKGNIEKKALYEKT